VRGTLAAYLRRRVGLQTLGMLAVLVAVLQLLELLDVTTEILERGQGLPELLYYAWLRAPAELVLALPLAVLLGAITALQPMARALEIASIRTSGVSLLQMLGHLLPLVVAIALAQFALSEWMLPGAEARLKQWWSASAPPKVRTAPLWAHTSGGAVSIENLSPDATRLSGVRIYARDAAGRMTARISANSATWDGEGWRLEGVSEVRIGASAILPAEHASRPWPTNLRPEEVLRLDIARPRLSSTMLVDVIAGTRVGTQPRSYYQTNLYRSFTAPLGVLVMMLLALPTACAAPRTGGAREMLVALLLGLGFLLCDGIAASLGAGGQLPPLATALAAPAVFLLIGLLRVKACERT
jgi:lipopolysaccharide export system permease protein